MPTEATADHVRAMQTRATPRQDRSWWRNRGDTCGQPLCRCTHDAPCDRGWLDMPPVHANGMDYQRVAPCPICRPGAATRYQRDLEATSRKVHA